MRRRQLHPTYEPAASPTGAGRPRRTDTLCAAAGCTKPRRRGDLCGAHDQQMRTHGRLKPLRSATPPRRCAHRRCAKMADAAGLCWAHYQARRRARLRGHR